MLPEKLSRAVATLRRAEFLSVWAAALVLSGCFPIIAEDYYRPSASKGDFSLTQPWCKENYGPLDGIQFDRNGAKIQVRIARASESEIRLSIRVELFRGNEAMFAGGIVHVTVGTDATELRLEGEVTGRMIGETREVRMAWFERDYPMRFFWESRLGKGNPGRVKVLLPEMIVNGERCRFPEITFEKDTFTDLFAPINC